MNDKTHFMLATNRLQFREGDDCDVFRMICHVKQPFPVIGLGPVGEYDCAVIMTRRRMMVPLWCGMLCMDHMYM